MKSLAQRVVCPVAFVVYGNSLTLRFDLRLNCSYFGSRVICDHFFVHSLACVRSLRLDTNRRYLDAAVVLGYTCTVGYADGVHAA